jgi:NADH-quinone oxidoreductase subunit C
MTPEEVQDKLGHPAALSGGGDFARVTVDVPAQSWHEVAQKTRDELGCDFFDWLSAVDELADGYRIVAHVWSVASRFGLLLRTLVPNEAAAVASIVDIYPGAAWHERETHEMFGVDFAGHPGLERLLLPPEFEGHPLRKDFVLASRVAKDWPGAKEPGESDHAPTKRQKMRPPGVPDPTEWGPAATPRDRAE